MMKYLKKALAGEKLTWNTVELFGGDATVESYF